MTEKQRERVRELKWLVKEKQKQINALKRILSAFNGEKLV